ARVLRRGRRDRALQPRLDGDPAVPRRKRRLGRGARARAEAQARRGDRSAARGAVTLERGATIDTLRLRAAMLDRVRAFFAARGVLEVETASLSPAAPTDPALESIAAHVERLGGARYLHTSPEFAMKRLLADGIGDIYQLCRVYRDGEIGRWHQPEFTMLEWYRLAFDDAQLMDEVEALVRAVVGGRAAEWPALRVTYRDAFEQALGVDPLLEPDAVEA